MEQAERLASGVRATGLADEVAYRLQVSILDGEFQPGTRLQQDELCLRFGVSRTPIREALRKLQAMHLVELIPNKGATVRMPTRDDLADVYAVRCQLEGFAAELAAERASPRELKALAESCQRSAATIEKVESGSREGDPGLQAAVRESNEKFHLLIQDAAGNRRLSTQIDDLRNAFPKDHVSRVTTTASELRELNIDDHARILEAIRAGDSKVARSAMESHIRRAGKILMRHLDARDSWR